MSPTPSVDFEVVVTSCGRFDLLRRSMTSLVATLDVPPRRILVIEDSGDEGVRDALAGLDGPFEVVVNSRQLGQMASIDKAYAMLAAPYVFHTEDDWQFERTGFIGESAALLAARPRLQHGRLRPRSELNPLIRDMPEETVAGVRHFPLDPTRHPEYSAIPSIPACAASPTHAPSAPSIRSAAKRTSPMPSRSGASGSPILPSRRAATSATIDTSTTRPSGERPAPSGTTGAFGA